MLIFAERNLKNRIMKITLMQIFTHQTQVTQEKLQKQG